MAVFRGKITAWNSGTYKASVRIDGSPGEVVSNIPVDRGLESADMVVGRACLLDTGDTQNPADFVLTTVWA